MEMITGTHFTNSHDLMSQISSTFLLILCEKWMSGLATTLYMSRQNVWPPLNHVDYSHIDTNAPKLSIMSSQTLYEMRPRDSYAVD